MNKTFRFSLISTSAAIAALLTACETTGNPYEGGIFWSPQKAMERRTTILEEQAAKLRNINHLEQKTASYTSERNRLRQEKKKLEAQRKAANSLQDKASIDKAIDDIEAELENM